eukprot:CAMPEP_0185587566 /NCGR_PEP_ID=MMETSP0434-20130131/49697_1 /TAXON_ID=626734 ORGANISM="Favella taraikaensis, Strain Fe Narragansett Bay" /NCGR_SAMPLE_ID=MMETSP0434 /ASSEMBLY_ACC=CAM_ASM_000379 /LENGTH=62 /DNA_ID=CAMNT_0028209559 /DNA_START=62 /DNA_END=247 /DNA_ORIENTATION=-
MEKHTSPQEMVQKLRQIQSVIPQDNSPMKKDLDAIKKLERKFLRKRDAHLEIRRRPSKPASQ